MSFKEEDPGSIQALLSALKPSLDSMNGNNTEKTQEARNTSEVESARDMGIHPPRNPEIDSLLELLGPSAPSTAQKQRSSLPISSTSIPAPKAPALPSKLPLVQQNVQSKVEEPPLETISEDEALQLRSMTFPQALMLVPTLPAHKIAKLTEIRKQQDKLEKTLHTEYSVMNSKFTNARKELEQKATLARIDLSRDMARLDGDFAKKVDAFKTKALSRWDELRPQQQSQLEQLHIPCFYVTEDVDAISTQAKILAAIASQHN
ncbi:hypothetical protein E3Q13_01816 [Wallemia mellicola]|nr:hypothetical protein E3Q13_01816 [Wallemia mellicola]